MNDFWAKQVQPTAPAEQTPANLGAAYKAHRRLTSSSRLYDPAPEPQAKTNIYAGAIPPKALADYSSTTPRSKWDQQPGQSDADYEAKLRPYLNHLAEKLDP